MDQGEEKKQVDWRRDWNGYYQASYTNISENLGKIDRAKDASGTPDVHDLYHWLDQSYFRQRIHLEILDSYQKRLDSLENTMTKVLDALRGIKEWIEKNQPLLDEVDKDYGNRARRMRQDGQNGEN